MWSHECQEGKEEEAAGKWPGVMDYEGERFAMLFYYIITDIYYLVQIKLLFAQ